MVCLPRFGWFLWHMWVNRPVPRRIWEITWLLLSNGPSHHVTALHPFVHLVNLEVPRGDVHIFPPTSWWNCMNFKKGPRAPQNKQQVDSYSIVLMLHQSVSLSQFCGVAMFTRTRGSDISAYFKHPKPWHHSFTPCRCALPLRGSHKNHVHKSRVTTRIRELLGWKREGGVKLS